MKIEFFVHYDDGSTGEIEFEKPAGAHPESELTISTAFLSADTDERTAVAICRKRNGVEYGGWTTRKQAAPMILNVRDAK